MDFVGRKRGQIKVSVQPDKDSAETKMQLRAEFLATFLTINPALRKVAVLAQKVVPRGWKHIRMETYPEHPEAMRLKNIRKATRLKNIRKLVLEEKYPETNASERHPEANVGMRSHIRRQAGENTPGGHRTG